MACTDGWRVTGYYTPVESDFSGDSESITLADGTHVKVPSKFAASVKEEGWGRMSAGWCLGWDGRWTRSDQPLDSHGNALVIGSAATDASKISRNLQFTIPTLPSPWNDMTFTATDAGSAIVGKHVDIYCGEGKEAEQNTYHITGNDNTLCL